MISSRQAAVRLIVPSLLLGALLGLRTILDDIAALFPSEFSGSIVYSGTLFLETAAWVVTAWLIGRLGNLLIVSRRAGLGRAIEPPKLLGDVVMIALISGSVLISLAVVFDQPIAGLVATSGFLAAVVGFALRNMISDLFSGIALNMERPFEIGDWIEIDSGEQGEIIEMNWRATRLVTIQGRMVVVSNSQLADGKLINLYRPQRVFRVVKTLVVDYQAPAQRVVDIFMAAILSTDGVVTDHLPNIVLIERSTDRGIEYGLHFWVDDAVRRYVIEHQVMVNALDFLNQAGLAPAYPKLDVSLAKAERRQIEREVDTMSLLGRVELLKALPPDALVSLAANLTPIEIDPRTEVVRQRDPGDSLFVLVSGLADVLVADIDGTEARHMGTLRPGAVFGEMSLLTGIPRVASVTALTTVIVFEITKSDLQPIFKAHPAIVDELTDLQTKRIATNQALLVLSEEEQQEVSEKGMKDFLSSRIRKFFML
jgi:small-conductance mechanosensitive channel